MKHLTLQFATCSQRDGKRTFSLSNFEEAVQTAIQYVTHNAERGESAGVDFLFYDHSKNIPLRFQFAINAKWSGKRYSNGYSIPVNDGTVEVRYFDDTRFMTADERFENADYWEYVMKVFKLVPKGSQYRLCQFKQPDSIEVL